MQWIVIGKPANEHESLVLIENRCLSGRGVTRNDFQVRLVA